MEALRHRTTEYVAVSWMGGVSSVLKADWSSLFERTPIRPILLVPDNNNVGIQAMEKLASFICSSFTSFKDHMKWVDTKALDPNKDIADLPDKVDINSFIADNTKPYQHEISLQDIGYSEREFAKYFFVIFRPDTFKHVDETSAWLRMERNSVWTPISETRIITDIQSFTEQIAFLSKGYQTYHFYNSIVKQGKSLREVNIKQAELDNDHNLWGTPDGILDLSQDYREMQSFDTLKNTIVVRYVLNPETYVTKSLLVAPCPSRSCPTFKKLLTDICRNRQAERNPDKEEFLNSWLGYLMSSGNEEKLLFLTGGGANGKSKLLEILKYVLHDYCKRAHQDTFKKTRNDQHPAIIAFIRDARILLIDELPAQLDLYRIKDIVSADSITSRGMRENFSTIDINVKLTIASNKMPSSIMNADESVKRRFLFFPCEYQIPEDLRDTELRDKLKNEACAVLHYILEQHELYKVRKESNLSTGLIVPDCLKAFSHQFYDERDLIKRWVADCCEVGQDNRINSKVAWNSFKKWCNDSNEPLCKKPTFRKLMERAGYSYQHIRAGGVSIWV